MDLIFHNKDSFLSNLNFEIMLDIRNNLEISFFRISVSNCIKITFCNDHGIRKSRKAAYKVIRYAGNFDVQSKTHTEILMFSF